MTADPREEMRRLREPWVQDARAVPLLDAFGLANGGAVLKRQGTEHVGPCPHCGGRDRFSIHPGRGKGNCRGAAGGAW